MSAQTAWLLIVSGTALMFLGTAMLWAPRWARAVGPFAGWAGALTCMSVVCGLITGVQWAVLSHTSPGAAWAIALWLPAFLAAATVARLLTVLRLVRGRRRVARALRRGRRGDR
jgi:hypothetical protein